MEMLLLGISKPNCKKEKMLRWAQESNGFDILTLDGGMDKSKCEWAE